MLLKSANGSLLFFFLLLLGHLRGDVCIPIWGDPIEGTYGGYLYGEIL